MAAMKKYALVVGISEYADPEITDLSFAARDAEEVGTCLVEACGFDEVRTLASGGDREPDHVNVVDALHNLAPRLLPEDLFLFYFAGHGIETKTGAHLLTANSRIRMPELAAVSKDVLSSCLSRIECADRVLILDACRNDPRKGMGDADNLLTSSFSRDIMALAETSVEGVLPTTAVLFSCRLGERAYEWPDVEHGAFTHYLLEGLRGAAMDDDGRITVQALGRYVETHVPRWAKKFGTPHPQTPCGEQRGSWREVLLAAAQAGSAPLPRPEPTVAEPQRVAAKNSYTSMKGNDQMGTKCSECGRKVSATVKKCPHCGASSDKIRTAAAGLETLLTLGNIVQDDGSESDQAQTDREAD